MAHFDEQDLLNDVHINYIMPVGMGEEWLSHDNMLDYRDVTGAAEESKICLCGCTNSKVMIKILRELSSLDKQNQEKVLKAVLDTINEDIHTDSDDESSDEIVDLTVGAREKRKKRKPKVAPLTFPDEQLVQPITNNSDKVFLHSSTPSLPKARIAHSPLGDIKRGFALSNIFNASDAFGVSNDIPLLPSGRIALG
jgi:hypothetical protein